MHLQACISSKRGLEGGGSVLLDCAGVGAFPHMGRRSLARIAYIGRYIIHTYISRVHTYIHT